MTSLNVSPYQYKISNCSGIDISHVHNKLYLHLCNLLWCLSCFLQKSSSVHCPWQPLCLHHQQNVSLWMHQASSQLSLSPRQRSPWWQISYQHLQKWKINFKAHLLNKNLDDWFLIIQYRMTCKVSMDNLLSEPTTWQILPKSHLPSKIRLIYYRNLQNEQYILQDHLSNKISTKVSS